ncbi:D-methionine ABC transporter, ATP-binding protein [Alteracholeplasma palmae J233]|uniref:D-methionine ABC transporter, ATP-binding protein n=1 Tax=Alteracholeplasma palmae (strain ATCC 49389 / J233) TaxID=1318466 RepID=U4KN85_ALTPJ|nr:ATP-binding cassette domain-containing protein [Alteracholeplasma palmae]CCV63635.1 D-methionine ABC transporter, ATP-binding protein [Alteracholeplasma palmae J233]
MIKLENITKTYKLKNKEEFKALDNINLTINEKEVLGIVGYSGAGKSSLLRIINLLIKPTSGRIIVDNKDMLTLKRKELERMRHTIGMVFQNFNLLNQLTVYQNIKLILDISNYTEDKEKRIIEVLTLVNLLDKKDEYPSKLSGGQKQRVGIARAIANKPKYLLCDEITSALDQKTSIEVIELLKDIKEKTDVTIIFITHQIDMVRKICDRVIVMEDGKIVEENKTLDLFISPQSSVSKNLIETDLKLDLNKNENIYRLIYKGNTKETILSDVIKKYQINTSILKAQTIDIKDEVIGYLFIEITGDKTLEAINYLKNNKIEVTQYV